MKKVKQHTHTHTHTQSQEISKTRSENGSWREEKDTIEEAPAGVTRAGDSIGMVMQRFVERVRVLNVATNGID